jgi:diguanylate cyclase (GGDEF)-like protein
VVTVPSPFDDLREHLFFYLYIAVGASLVSATFGHVVGRASDALAESRESFKVLSEIDELTRLPNRRTFEAARKRLSTEASANGIPLGCLYLDIDEFKRFNDDFGHAAGDEVLVVLGRILGVVGREGDVPGRLGGDEFGLLMPGATREAALGVAERIRQELREAGLEIPNLTITPAVSIGMAFAQEKGALDHLMRDADADLFELKRSRRLAREASRAAVVAAEADSPDEV